MKVICCYCGSRHDIQHYWNHAATGAVKTKQWKFYCSFSCYYLSKPHPMSLWDTTESPLYGMLEHAVPARRA